MLRLGRRRVYWDSCVWLDYISEVPEDKDVLDILLRDSSMRSGNIHLITSVIALTEVAFGATEKSNRALDDDVEQKIDSLWKDTTAVTLVEFYPAIALKARGIIRLSIGLGWTGLRALDAIHLATAQHLHVDEFHTTDTKLHRYSNELGFPITAPFVHGHPSSEDRPRLFE